MTIKELKEAIKDLPDDANVHAYEGEGIGIIVRTAEYDFSIGEIETNKSWWFGTGPA